MNKESIYHILSQNSATIKSYGISTLGIFGSYVRGEQTSESDIDLFVEFEKGKKSYRQYINLVYFLEDLLKKQVDVLTPKSISPLFKEQIKKEMTYVPLDN